MEAWLKLLPPRPGSYALRYTLTALMVAAAAGIVVLMNREGGYYAFFIFFFVIFLSSVLFDHMSGFVATALCTAIMYFQLREPGTGVFFERPAPILSLFVATSIGVALISEGLRKAWERAVIAERTSALLLEELRHRTKNDLAMVGSILALQTRAAQNHDVKAALDLATARIRAIAGANAHFGPDADQSSIDIREYLTSLCSHLSDSVRGIRPVRIELDVDSKILKARDALPLGLIVNELVTNALKYAFPENRAGMVRVTLKNGSHVLMVEDDGVGLQAGQKNGIGTRLTRMLAQQLDGSIAWEEGNPGCRVRVEIGSGKA